MISSKEILVALNIMLNNMQFKPDIVYYPDSPLSADDDTVKDVVYLTAFDMPTDSESPTISGSGYENDTGIYQINVQTPRGWGAMYAKELADYVKLAFPRSTKTDLTSGGVLTIRKVVQSGGGYENGNHYTIPVSVYWRCVG